MSWKNREGKFKQMLEDMTSFPARIKISLYKEHETSEFSILASLVSGNLKKKKIENIKFAECQSFVVGGHTIPLHIEDFADAESVIEKVNALSEIWSGKVVKEESA